MIWKMLFSPNFGEDKWLPNIFKTLSNFHSNLKIFLKKTSTANFMGVRNEYVSLRSTLILPRLIARTANHRRPIKPRPVSSGAPHPNRYRLDARIETIRSKIEEITKIKIKGEAVINKKSESDYNLSEAMVQSRVVGAVGGRGGGVQPCRKRAGRSTASVQTSQSWKEIWIQQREGEGRIELFSISSRFQLFSSARNDFQFTISNWFWY